MTDNQAWKHIAVYESGKEYYEQEVNRAWEYFLSELRKGVNVVTAIGKVRGGYGEALASTVQDRIAERLAK